LADLDGGILLSVHLGNACAVATVIVHQNVVWLAFKTDVSEIVSFTSDDVDITFPLKNMVIFNALLAVCSVQRIS